MSIAWRNSSVLHHSECPCMQRCSLVSFIWMDFYGLSIQIAHVVESALFASKPWNTCQWCHGLINSSCCIVLPCMKFKVHLKGTWCVDRPRPCGRLNGKKFCNIEQFETHCIAAPWFNKCTGYIDHCSLPFAPLTATCMDINRPLAIGLGYNQQWNV